MTKTYDYLLIGGGMTADSAARGIREIDETGSIGLFSLEQDPPYSRPPLSKGLWQGDDPADTNRETADLDVELHLGTGITAIDRAAHTVTDSNGTTWGYRRLLLATGGTPRRLQGDDAQVIYFRTMADYRRLRELTREPRRVLVLGGGYIGSEVAAALSMNGHDVSMAFPEQDLLARLLPAELAAHVSAHYRSKGVTLQPGRMVERVDGLTVTFADGGTESADVIIAGLGIIPNVELAESAGLAVDNGIEVDGFMRTADPDVFAAGDVANYPDSGLKRRRRVEHEQHANDTGMTAGKAMAGAPEAYAKIPLYYSDLFELGFEGVGIADSRLETAADWAEPLAKGTIRYLEDGRLVGGLMWDNWGLADAMRQEIEAG